MGEWSFSVSARVEQQRRWYSPPSHADRCGCYLKSSSAPRPGDSSTYRKRPLSDIHRMASSRMTDVAMSRGRYESTAVKKPTVFHFVRSVRSVRNHRIMPR